MKQLILICSTLLLISLSACISNREKKIKPNSVEYETYHNRQYRYSVEYPTFLVPQGESDNGDGQSFFSEDNRIKLLVYSDYKNDYLTGGELYTLEEAFREDLKMIEGVFNNKIEVNYYIIEYKTDEIVYTYYAQLYKDNYYNILFKYTEEEKDMMKDIIEHVIESVEVGVSAIKGEDASVGSLEDMFPVFLEGFLNDCYWGKNFNSLLSNKDETLNAYIDSNMDVRRYHAPGTITILASREDNFGFDKYSDFETKNQIKDNVTYKLLAEDEHPCDLDFEHNNNVYYQWQKAVPDLLVNIETFETDTVETVYPNAEIMVVYVPNSYNSNPIGLYFLYTPGGWKLAFVDDSLCGA